MLLVQLGINNCTNWINNCTRHRMITYIRINVILNLVIINNYILLIILIITYIDNYYILLIALSNYHYRSIIHLLIIQFRCTNLATAVIKTEPFRVWIS